jgi:hypothetical protein
MLVVQRLTLLLLIGMVAGGAIMAKRKNGGIKEVINHEVIVLMH